MASTTIVLLLVPAMYYVLALATGGGAHAPPVAETAGPAPSLTTWPDPVDTAHHVTAPPPFHSVDTNGGEAPSPHPRAKTVRTEHQ
jgi:hypothetical protein